MAFALGLVASCGPPATHVDLDEGPIEQFLTDTSAWPGTDQASGRVLLSLRGFADGKQIGYWFLGFGARRTADSFWFCREGDTACPLDEHRRLSWDHLVGHPLFTRIPGDPEFSPFWQMWVVRVPDDFEPDSVKTVESLDRLANAGDVRADRYLLDFGKLFAEAIGPKEVILHCALVLAGTQLSEDDMPLLDNGGTMLRLVRRQGWFKSRRVEFVDFSPSEGVLPAADDSESRALTRVANVYITWRSCEQDPMPAICDIPSAATPKKRSVSERGLGQDITGDGDTGDTNNVFGSAQCSLKRPAEIPYSPLWGPQAVMVKPARILVDNGDQYHSEMASADDVFDSVTRSLASTPTPMTEDESGNPIPGNDGRVLFDCPFAVPEGFVPYPCEDNPK